MLEIKAMHMRGRNQEILLLTRYAGTGVIKTIVGFICIFAAMMVGFSPIVSNIIGYGIGFLLGFIFSKKFVFRGNGDYVAEGVRYLLAFIFCFLANLMMLQLALYYGVHTGFSQLFAAGTYTILMYLLSRLFIFKNTL